MKLSDVMAGKNLKQSVHFAKRLHDALAKKTQTEGGESSAAELMLSSHLELVEAAKALSPDKIMKLPGGTLASRDPDHHGI